MSLIYNLIIFLSISSTYVVFSGTIQQQNNDQKKNKDKIVACYIGSWSVYRPARGSFTIENIDPNLCTHLIYSFAGLDSETNSIKSLDPWQDLADNYGKDGYGRIVKIRQTHPHIKVSLALGGWNEGSEKYSKLVNSTSRRISFVNSAVTFLKKYNFDGLDLDWEFPTQRGGIPEDKQNFVALVKELHNVFQKNDLLLTAAFNANPKIIDESYDVRGVSKYLDFLHIMNYDYHGVWDEKTGPNAPLYSADDLSVDYSIKYFLKLGAPREKLVMGLAFYGRTFNLINAEENVDAFGSMSKSGFQGPFTRENGFMGYNEICLELQNNTDKWRIHWDQLSETSFAVHENQFIAYDNPKSIAEKVRVALKYRIAGVMVWSIDTDDFHGDCKNEDVPTKEKGYPMLRTINIVLAEPPPVEDSNEIPTDGEDIKDESSNGSITKTNVFLIISVVISLITGLF